MTPHLLRCGSELSIVDEDASLDLLRVQDFEQPIAMGGGVEQTVRYALMLSAASTAQQLHDAPADGLDSNTGLLALVRIVNVDELALAILRLEVERGFAGR
jgi:hypothetical protein